MFSRVFWTSMTRSFQMVLCGHGWQKTSGSLLHIMLPLDPQKLDRYFPCWLHLTFCAPRGVHVLEHFQRQWSNDQVQTGVHAKERSPPNPLSLKGRGLPGYIYIYQFALLQRWTGPRFCLSRNSHNMSQQIMIYLCRDHPWIIYDPFLCLRHSSPSSLEMLIQCKLGWSGWSTNSISYRSDLSSSSADQGCTQSRTLNSHAYNELFWDDFPY